MDHRGRRNDRIELTTFAYAKGHHNFWRYICDCGNVGVVDIGNFKATKSCGCLRREMTIARNTTHGLGRAEDRPPEYESWSGIIQRCTNPKRDNFKYYGGRGITVCDRWLKFENFLADMGYKPSPAHSIERRDNDGPYDKDNCYWATRLEQGRNKRNNRWYLLDGERKTLAECARELGVSRDTAAKRLQEVP